MSYDASLIINKRLNPILRTNLDRGQPHIKMYVDHITFTASPSSNTSIQPAKAESH
jgi:hypothetical protein